MANDGEKTASEEEAVTRIRSHVTITRAQPLLLEEVASVTDGLRSARITSLANLGLLVERGFFSGEFFRALQSPEVQRALMGFRATNHHLEKKSSSAEQLEKLGGSASSSNSDKPENSLPAIPQTDSCAASPLPKDSTDNDQQPGRGVIVEQMRPEKTVRMR